MILKCATATRAVGAALTGTRRRWWWTPIRLRRIDHCGGRAAGQRCRQSGGAGVGGAERGQRRCSGGGGHGGTPPTATAAPARLLLMRVASWWPECRVVPTGSVSPRMTASSTWRREAAPVRQDRSPAPSCQRGNAPTVLGRSIAGKPSGSTARCARAVCYGPDALRPQAGRDGRC